MRLVQSRFLFIAITSLVVAGCAASKKPAAGVTIRQNEIPKGTTIAESLHGARVAILKPLIVEANFARDPENASTDPRIEQNYIDSAAMRFWNTFDSVFRVTVRDESLAMYIPTPKMPIDSLHAYDSLYRLSSGGSFDLALVPDVVELIPSASGERDESVPSGGRNGGRGGGGGGRHGGGGSGPKTGGGAGHRGGQATLICNYTIFRASDKKTIFSGQFVSTNAPIGGHGQTAAAVKAICQEFLQWKNE